MSVSTYIRQIQEEKMDLPAEELLSGDERAADSSNQDNSLFLKASEDFEVSAPDGYEFMKTIGDGSFGKVKLGVHKLTGQQVAIKILWKERIKERTDIERISRQIKIMKVIKHPFVVQMYEIIESPKYLFLIMEFVQGGDLFDAISQATKLPEDVCKVYFGQIVLGLEYLHSLGITHRDMKPENILIGEGGKIKIADFGLGNFFTENQKLKTACGSPCYAPPEMLNQEEYDPRKVDIWSSGVLLYAMIHGYLPFEDEVTTQLYEKIKTKNVRVASSVSIPCRNLLRGLLTKSPAERWDLDFIKKHDFLIETVASQQLYVEKETKEMDLNQFKQICEYLGIVEEDRLLNNLRKNKHNNLTTLFYLGKRQILRNLGDNISFIPSDKTEESVSHSSVEVFNQSESGKNEVPQTIEHQSRKLYSFVERDETKAEKELETVEKINQTINDKSNITEYIAQESKIQQSNTQIVSNSKIDQSMGIQYESPIEARTAPDPITIEDSITPRQPPKQFKEEETIIQHTEKSKVQEKNQTFKDIKTPKPFIKTAIQPTKIAHKPPPSPKGKKITPIVFQPVKKPEPIDKTPKITNKGLKKAQRMPIYKPKQDHNKTTQADIKLYERSHSKDRPIVLKNNLKTQKSQAKQKVEEIGQVTSKVIHVEPHLIDAQRIALCSAEKLCSALGKNGLSGNFLYYSYGKECIFVSKVQLKPVKTGKAINSTYLEKIINEINQTA